MALSFHLCVLLQVQAQLAEVSTRFLAKVSPKGAGALSFGLSKGKLVLLGAQMGECIHVTQLSCAGVCCPDRHMGKFRVFHVSEYSNSCCHMSYLNKAVVPRLPANGCPANTRSWTARHNTVTVLNSRHCHC